ncbi:MAG: RHS repeat domain-containing protein [Nitrospiraceae bacterium]
MMARYYASSLGRFLASDPSHISVDSKKPLTWNAYLYAENSPIGRYDPNGLASVEARALDFWGIFSLRGTMCAGTSWGGSSCIHGEHWQIYLNNGQNFGFFDDDAIRADRSNLPHDTLASGYDDDLMKQAVNNVKAGWKSEFCTATHNCHNFVEAVLMEYYTLLYAKCGPEGCANTPTPQKVPPPKKLHGRLGGHGSRKAPSSAGRIPVLEKEPQAIVKTKECFPKLGGPVGCP